MAPDYRKPVVTYEAVIFIAMFTLLFIITNIVMISHGQERGLTVSQDPFMILILVAILTFLFKNSKTAFTPLRRAFLILWGVYVLSMIISMVVASHFVWTELLILLLITAVLCFRIPRRLVNYLVISALASLPSFLLADTTLNESGATLVLAATAGLLLIPKTNKAMLLYILPTFALLLVITTGRTAILVYVMVMLVQLAWINLYRKPARQQKRFIGTVAAGALAILVLFAGPLYRFFMNGSLSRAGIDWNELTSQRYVLWATVWHNREWFGEGHDYFIFTGLLHAHNILFDTLGRYGIITVILFMLVMLVILLLSLSIKTMNIALYIFAFLLVGMFEYSYLFMFTYFSPVILFFILMAYLLTLREDNFKIKRAE